MNEKGAVAITGAFPLAPVWLPARIDAAFGRLGPSPDALTLVIEGIDRHIVAETDQLLIAAGLTPMSA